MSPECWRAAARSALAGLQPAQPVLVADVVQEREDAPLAAAAVGSPPGCEAHGGGAQQHRQHDDRALKDLPHTLSIEMPPLSGNPRKPATCILENEEVRGRRRLQAAEPGGREVAIPAVGQEDDDGPVEPAGARRRAAPRRRRCPPSRRPARPSSRSRRPDRREALGVGDALGGVDHRAVEHGRAARPRRCPRSGSRCRARRLRARPSPRAPSRADRRARRAPPATRAAESGRRR